MAGISIGPLRPIHHIAVDVIARDTAERIFRCRAVPGSPQWRSYVEGQIRHAIAVAAASPVPREALV
jgi:hypothetical protein